MCTDITSNASISACVHYYLQNIADILNNVLEDSNENGWAQLQQVSSASTILWSNIKYFFLIILILLDPVIEIQGP